MATERAIAISDDGANALIRLLAELIVEDFEREKSEKSRGDEASLAPTPALHE